jgi:hypothetical protein
LRSVHGVAYSPDGTLVATTGDRKAPNVYRHNVSDVIELAQKRYRRGFTKQECLAYFLWEWACPKSE